jgi:hypothetical protein
MGLTDREREWGTVIPERKLRVEYLETTMPANWTITAGREPLDVGPAEERACFVAAGIQAHNRWLTEGRDAAGCRPAVDCGSGLPSR